MQSKRNASFTANIAVRINVSLTLANATESHPRRFESSAIRLRGYQLRKCKIRFNCCFSVHVDNYTIIVPTKCTSLLKEEDITICTFLSLYS
jgi:hypothetical protein